MLENDSWSIRCVFALTGAWFALNARDAHACGGCFHEAPPLQPSVVVDTSFVTDHRMVFSLSPQQTVLWDQVRFTGSPKDFAWVLPVKPGARIEMSHDAWISALDSTTQTTITGPTPPACAPSGGIANTARNDGGGGGRGPTEYTSGDPSGGGGCGSGYVGASGGVDTYTVPAAPNTGASPGAGSGAGGAPGPSKEVVQVVSQQVVGPYESVTVHSTQGEALGDWLRANGYDLPAAIQPTIDAYANSGFDFIALKLAPSVGVQAMQPVRIVTPGADPTLPLRMVAAGVGAHVGLELYVLSEGRYHAANFPDATIDFLQLAWDPVRGRSNYTELVQQALAAGDGTGWLTESSQLVDLYGTGAATPALASLYQSTCRTEVFVPTCAASPGTAPASPDGGFEETSPGDGAVVSDGAELDQGAKPDDGIVGNDGAAMDGGGFAKDGATASDGGSDSHDAAATDTVPLDGPDDATVDGGSVSADASTATPDGACGSPVVQPCDDLSVAMVGIAPGNLWVTRLRADFPASALTTDLVLEATALQTPVSSEHQTNVYTVLNYNPCPRVTSPPPASTPPADTTASAAPIDSTASACACRVPRRTGTLPSNVFLSSVAVAAFALSLRRRRHGGPQRKLSAPK